MNLFKYRNDLNFKKKLELSYQRCIDELTNPVDWETKIKEKKYEIDQHTGIVKTYIEFILSNSDEIDIPNIEHSYVFKRTHFYKNSKRLRCEMERVWNARGYFVTLYERYYMERRYWVLKVSWKH